MSIAGTVQVTGPIAPSATSDVFPSHIDIYGKGGFRCVADATARNAIPVDRCSLGMQVVTQSDGKVWQLTTYPPTGANGDWTQGGAGAVTSLTTTGSGAASLTSGVLNVPTPVVQSLTTTGSGAASLSAGVLNVPTPAAGGSSYADDPYAEFRALLLQFETTISGVPVDSSMYRRQMIVVGGGGVSTTNPKFGTQSYRSANNGATDRLDCNDVVGLNPGAGDFAIECWAYYSGISSWLTFFDCTPSGLTGRFYFSTYPGAAKMYVQVGGGTDIGPSASLSGLTVGMHHFMWSRVNGISNFLLDGVVVYTQTDTQTYNVGNSGFKSCYDQSTNSGVYDYFDQLSVIIGAGPSAGFTLPTLPYAPVTRTRQRGVKVLTSGASVAVDARYSNTFRLVLGTNAAIANPTNPSDGQELIFRIKQPPSGGPFIPTFGSKYNFAVTPTFSTAANAIDLVKAVYDAYDDTLRCELVGQAKSAGGGVVALTYASTVSVNAALGSNFRLTLAGDPTIASPTGLFDGQRVTLRLIQDLTGGRVPVWGSVWSFPAGVAPTLSTSANRIDLLDFEYDATDGQLSLVSFSKDTRNYVPIVTTTWDLTTAPSGYTSFTSRWTLSLANRGIANNATGTFGSTCFKATTNKTSGKFYFELYVASLTAGATDLGIGVMGFASSPVNDPTTGSGRGDAWYRGNGQSFSDGSNAYNGSFGAWSSGDTIGVAVNVGTDVRFYKNNTLVGTVSLATANVTPFLSEQGGSACAGVLRCKAADCVYAPPTGYANWD